MQRLEGFEQRGRVRLAAAGEKRGQRIDDDEIELARGADPRRPRSRDEIAEAAPPPSTWKTLDDVDCGSWPIDETDEEVNQALEELS